MRNLLKIILISTFLFYCILGSLTCKDDITNFDISSIVFPDHNVSYQNHIAPIFQHVCAIPGGCHAGENPAGERPLSLESYDDLTLRRDLLDYGNPPNSSLVRVLKGTLAGIEPMPLNRPKLNDNQINGFITWIREGARGDN